MENAGEFSCTSSLGEMDIRRGEEYSTSCTTKDERHCLDFGSASSDTWFGQDFELFQYHSEVGGGFRRVCWRVKFWSELYDLKHISPTEDAKFIFYMTKMIKPNTGATKDLLYKVIAQLII